MLYKSTLTLTLTFKTEGRSTDSEACTTILDYPDSQGIRQKYFTASLKDIFKSIGNQNIIDLLKILTFSSTVAFLRGFSTRLG